MTDRMLDCTEVIPVLWDYLDQELTPDHREAVAAHLAVCQRCYPQYDFERAFLVALKGVPVEGGAPAALRERVFGALRAEGLAGI